MYGSIGGFYFLVSIKINIKDFCHLLHTQTHIPNLKVVATLCLGFCYHNGTEAVQYASTEISKPSDIQGPRGRRYAKTFFRNSFYI